MLQGRHTRSYRYLQDIYLTKVCHLWHFFSVFFAVKTWKVDELIHFFLKCACVFFFLCVFFCTLLVHAWIPIYEPSTGYQFSQAKNNDSTAFLKRHCLARHKARAVGNRPSKCTESCGWDCLEEKVMFLGARYISVMGFFWVVWGPVVWIPRIPL